jgi:diguanylate cyclase (GGDEF)-like protein/PAS domain S-box-containing protein
VEEDSRAATSGGAGFDDAFHRDIVDNLADGVYYVDRERRITYWNHGAEALTGFAAGAVVGHRCFDDILKHVDGEGHGLCAGGCPLAATIEDGQRRELEVWLRHRDGSRRPVRVRTAPIRREGEIVGAVEIFDDAASLVAARRSASQAEHDALTDELTGLANRRMFDLILAARLEDLERYGTPLGLLLGDLDHFKAINDQHGHLVGDDVLRVVAATLRGAVRAGDLVARWGGEEFTVIANRATRRELELMAERVRALVAATDVSLASGGVVHPTISVGAALASAGEQASALLERADAALYAAKAGGRDRVAFPR